MILSVWMYEKSRTAICTSVSVFVYIFADKFCWFQGEHQDGSGAWAWSKSALGNTWEVHWRINGMILKNIYIGRLFKY